MRSSASCRTPSAFRSVSDSRPGWSLAQLETQAGSRSIGVPTNALNTSSLIITASTGTVRYSTEMNDKAQATDARAALGDGVA